MNEIFAVYKRAGETPLEMLGRVRIASPLFREEKLSYAGRLDPLAEGVVLVLAGEANKDREKYLGFDKTYYFDVLFGVESDSFDPLGLVKKGPPLSISNIEDVLEEFSYNRIGEMEQEYPSFSSKTVEGKPLFKWAREGIDVKKPSRKVFIREMTFLGGVNVPVSLIVKKTTEKVNAVKGDFRQDQVLSSWASVDSSFEKDAELYMARFKLVASSGTYVRSLARDIGLYCGSLGLAFWIFRSEVGHFGLDDTFL